MPHTTYQRGFPHFLQTPHRSDVDFFVGSKFLPVPFQHHFRNTQNSTFHNATLQTESATTSWAFLWILHCNNRDQAAAGHLRAVAMRSKMLKYESTSASLQIGTKATCSLMWNYFTSRNRQWPQSLFLWIELELASISSLLTCRRSCMCGLQSEMS